MRMGVEKDKKKKTTGMTFNQAWAFAQALGSRYGRPIVTGICAAEEQDPATGEGTGVWYVRVDFHSAEDGDDALLLDAPDTERVAEMFHVFQELNKMAAIREQQRTAANYLAAQTIGEEGGGRDGRETE